MAKVVYKNKNPRYQTHKLSVLTLNIFWNGKRVPLGSILEPFFHRFKFDAQSTSIRFTFPRLIFFNLSNLFSDCYEVLTRHAAR